MRYQPRLDAIRGLCIAAVFFCHEGVFDAGWIGVQVFFVLSGYLITEILLNMKVGDWNKRSYFSTFYLRRALRIFPAYFAYLIAIFVAERWGMTSLLAGEPQDSLANAPYLLTYTYNFHRELDAVTEHDALFAHLWSLSIEEQFYLIWPCLIAFLDRRSIIRLCLCIIAAGPVIRLLLAAWQWDSGPYARLLAGRWIYFSTFSHLDAFAFGAILNFARESLRVSRFLNFVSKAAPLGLVAVSALMLLLGQLARYHLTWSSAGWPTYLPYFNAFVWGYSFLNAGALALIANRDRLALLLDRRILQRLGRISYGFYIFHLPVIWYVKLYTEPLMADGALRSAAQMAVAFMSTWLLASASFRFLESPFLRLKARFGGRRESVDRVGHE